MADEPDDETERRKSHDPWWYSILDLFELAFYAIVGLARAIAAVIAGVLSSCN